ncbi:hypothetical protein [Pedobacter terrae]|uniref:hypothetical protein n=1 Tax=Pedobacter terrae TaxID=405671 RepID=UPI002FFA762D
MGNKIATEEDYWMCTGGIMPAQIQSIQRIAEQKDSKKYLIKSDTATASMGDFVCKWIMLIMALIAAVVAVLIVATGGAALGVLVAVGAAAGAAGAAFGSIVGGLVCGQKAAIARTWLGDKSNLMIGGQKTLTTGSTMECPVFGSKIVHAPNVKNWWDALRVGIGNFGETVILGALGGALIGLGGAVLSGSAALALPTLASVGTNILGSITGWGMAARLYFGANAVSNQQALGQIDINNVEERDAAFGNAAFPEYGSIKRIASGSAEPMDAMLLLYFLNLRVPGAKPGTSPKEEPAGGNKEEPVAPKEEQAKPKEEEVKPVENGKAENGAAKGKDGKAYEKGTGTKPKPKEKLQAGTPEHKQARWAEYETKMANNPKKWSYERWSKQYDTNMQNASHGLSREAAYREQLGGKSETIKTKFTNRQIDISRPAERYAGQVKTGKVALSKQAKIDIQKDAWLVKRGYKVEYILEKGASKPFIKALEKAGIDYYIGPKIP